MMYSHLYKISSNQCHIYAYLHYQINSQKIYKIIYNLKKIINSCYLKEYQVFGEEKEKE